jgi:hypothetical protein
VVLQLESSLIGFFFLTNISVFFIVYCLLFHIFLVNYYLLGVGWSRIYFSIGIKVGSLYWDNFLSVILVSA